MLKGYVKDFKASGPTLPPKTGLQEIKMCARMNEKDSTGEPYRLHDEAPMGMPVDDEPYSTNGDAGPGD